MVRAKPSLAFFSSYYCIMKTVLVVDDSRIMRNIVKNHFSELHIYCDYLEAEDGNEAFETLDSHTVDLVLLDWSMPGLSGIDFLRKIRVMEKYADLPVIMVTSKATKGNVIEALKTGATDYIVKPINAKLFAKKISKIFNWRII